MQLDVTQEQLAIVEELVRDKISALGTEIRHCDNPDYRQGLVQKREHLRHLSATLSEVNASGASSV